jgi:hypothetical protein
MKNLWLTGVFHQKKNLLFAFVLCQIGNSFCEIYTYDRAGQMESVTYDNGVSVKYLYDIQGNISQRIISAIQPQPRIQILNQNFQLTFEKYIGGTYTVWQSNDLIHWEIVHLATGHGTETLEILSTPGSNHRFFKVTVTF